MKLKKLIKIYKKLAKKSNLFFKSFDIFHTVFEKLLKFKLLSLINLFVLTKT
jgi:hypothetical protein